MLTTGTARDEVDSLLLEAKRIMLAQRKWDTEETQEVDPTRQCECRNCLATVELVSLIDAYLAKKEGTEGEGGK